MAEDRQGTEARVPAVPAEQPSQPAIPMRRQPPDPKVFAITPWEERRKAMPPQTFKNPDEELWSDRYTSEFQMVNLPNGRWKPIRPLFVAE